MTLGPALNRIIFIVLTLAVGACATPNARVRLDTSNLPYVLHKMHTLQGRDRYQFVESVLSPYAPAFELFPTEVIDEDDMFRWTEGNVAWVEADGARRIYLIDQVLNQFTKADSPSDKFRELGVVLVPRSEAIRGRQFPNKTVYDTKVLIDELQAEQELLKNYAGVSWTTFDEPPPAWSPQVPTTAVTIPENHLRSSRESDVKYDPDWAFRPPQEQRKKLRSLSDEERLEFLKQVLNPEMKAYLLFPQGARSEEELSEWVDWLIDDLYYSRYRRLYLVGHVLRIIEDSPLPSPYVLELGLSLVPHNQSYYEAPNAWPWIDPQRLREELIAERRRLGELGYPARGWRKEFKSVGSQ